MLTKILKENRIFVSILLLLVWAALVFWDSLQPAIPYATMPQAIMLIALGTWAVLQSRGAAFLKKQHFFIFFFLLLHLFWVRDWSQLSFFAGYIFMQFCLLQILLPSSTGGTVLNAFDIGFFATIATLFHPPLWVFLVFILLYYILWGSVQIRLLIIYILGILATLIIAAQVVILTDSYAVLDHIKSGLQPSFLPFSSAFYWQIPLILAGIYAIADYISHFNVHSEEKKHIHFHASILFLFGVAYIFLYSTLPGNLWMLILPTALFLANLTSKIQWIRAEIILWALLLTTVLYHFHSYIPVPELFQRITF
ncbi:MAG: DUF6427 family protein [Weeksellaceae bacterium]|nr:DUF6427 family protein [Weeksellaceae bacterium]